MYEGQTAFKILDVKENKDTAVVLIQFENGPFKQYWQDQLILVKENGWKMDNVIFKPVPNNGKSTKDVLLDFINAKD